MHCFTCATGELGYEGLHRHLLEAHPELVTVEVDGPTPQFVVACPCCPEQYRQAIKRGRVGADFVQEFAAEIRLVATDICVQHLIGEHGAALGVAVTKDPPTPDQAIHSTISLRRGRN